MSADSIVAKALKCIDEIYPSENTLNETYLPTDDFLEEMVRWVIDVAPVHELTEREIATGSASTTASNGVGRDAVPEDFGRLVYFKAEGWKRPVFGVITEDDPRYLQQSNKVLRGNPSRPIVAVVEGGKYFEWYTAQSQEYTCEYVPYAIDYIPTRLEDVASWKLAEIVLMSMSDAQNAAVCTARVNELLEQMAL
jgi:hypothetical protein